MEVTKLEEHGFNSALYGFSLSYKDRAIPRDEWWKFQKPLKLDVDEKDLRIDSRVRFASRIKKTATANAGRGKGHDKFLRQIQVWLDIEAPRYWWSEFDTYKVGTTVQSESTMHTLMKRDPYPVDFEDNSIKQVTLLELKSAIASGKVHKVKKKLPESYKQRRVVTLNYAVLRCIVEQRKKHPLPEWKTFIDAIYDQVDHKELLPKRN